MRTPGQRVLADIAAIVTNGIPDIESKVIATHIGGVLHQLPVLLLREMLVEILVQRGSTIEILNEILAVKPELIQDAYFLVLRCIEIRTVKVP